MKLKKLFFIIFLLNLFPNFILSNKLPKIHQIISATLNGTAAYVSLEDINRISKHLYFSFDFDYHHSAVKKDNNIAYFLITTDFEFLRTGQERIEYGFMNQTMNEIKDELSFENIEWKRVIPLHVDKKPEDNKHYIQIKRGKKKEKLNTLIIRIPTKRRHDGSITVENILELPNFSDEIVIEL